MYNTDDKEELLTKLNIAVEAVSQLDVDETGDILALLDERTITGDQECCVNLGVKALLIFNSLYREPDKAKDAFEALLNTARER